MSPENRIPELAKEEKKSINGEHASRISGAAMAGSGSLNESQADDMQAANCVISWDSRILGGNIPDDADR